VSKFARINLMLSLAMIAGFLCLLFLAVYDVFQDKALPSDISILLLIGSAVTGVLGLGSFLLSYAKALTVKGIRRNG
jgi:hypothetical protein